MLGRLIFTAMLAVFVVASDQSSALSASKRETGQKLSLESVNGAQWRGKGGNVSTALLVKLQILLDRAHASPGQIDATRGENTRKAIVAYRDMRGLGNGERIDEPLWRALTDHDSEPALTTYVITEKDVAEPFIEKVPDDYREKAALKRLGYTGVQEMLAEKFHMSEQLLRRLNLSAAFDQPGTELIVANVQRDALPRKVARIEVNAAKQRVSAYDKDDRLVAVYPATVGSSERPSPTGDLKVTAIAENPTYHYDPALNLRGVDVEEKLELPPGPNNPVGIVWIALSAKGYGIHGTPDPEAVSKRASHGCIRMTNWDALELARHVSKGTPVHIDAGSKGQAKRP
jgi:lipoprotein-anchoring transpeptidase ErfK/SrfK